MLYSIIKTNTIPIKMIQNKKNKTNPLKILQSKIQYNESAEYSE